MGGRCRLRDDRGEQGSQRRRRQHRRRGRSRGALAYGTIASLADYWMVDYESRIVEVWHRGPDGWERADYVGQRSVPVTCLGIEIALADIVAGVTTRSS